MEKELIETHIKILLLELEIYNKELSNLENHKPFKFQKRKLEKYITEKNNIKTHIEKCNDKIKKQRELLSRVVEN